MANIIEIIIKANNQASGALDSALDKLSSVGQSMQNIGKNMAVATAPIALALGMAVNSAMAFDESMTNVGAVLGKGRAEMASLNKEVLKLGAASRSGPQAASEAFYDIVGGIQDADSHMAILEASIKTAEAGSADLGATTNALVSVMNSYGFGAEDAAYASDVLTRTVGMGVGSMEQFAGALPKLTGLASSVGIEFGSAATAAAYMTTKGFTASESVTRLSSAINSILTPNKEMAAALSAAGIESGAAALEMYGLAGTLGRVEQALGGSKEAMAAAMGSSEAMAAATALNEASFEGFIETFEGGIAGATAAAQKIQLESPAAQFDLLKSKVAAMGITVGDILLPPILELSNKIMPIVDGVLAWGQANPQAMTGIVAVAVAAVAAGPVIGMLGMAITGVTTAIGILLSPAVLLVGAIAAIVAAAQLGYPGGIVGLFNDATRTAQQLAFLGLYVLNIAAQTARQGLINLANGLSDAFLKAGEFARGLLGLTLAGGAFIVLLTQSKMAVTLWTVATSAAQAISAAATAVWGFMSGSLGILTGFFGGATIGVGSFTAAVSAAALPIIAVGVAIAGVIAQISEFNRVTDQGRQSAQGVAAEGLKSGKINKQDIYDQAFKSAQAEHGDLFARLFYSNIANDVIGGAEKQNMGTMTISGMRAKGGDVLGGRNYIVGEEGPEILSMPLGGNGTITPNNQIGSAGGTTIQTGPITIQANSRAEGEEAADGFMTRMDELIRAGG